MSSKHYDKQTRYGVSFSLKQCRNFDMDWQPVLKATLNDLGVRRFRLMSYWNEHEAQQGTYDFTELDKQIAIIERAGGVITLCLGVRQPRWPENHWPEWAVQLGKSERTTAILTFIQTVVDRYKTRPCIISWQLENEALLASFGERPEIDRARLRQEFQLVKKLDPKRPIIMSTSTSWGIPVRQPIPDIVGFSYYQVVYNQGAYSVSFHRPWLDRLRAQMIRFIHRRPSFIHELQAEPWGPKNIWEMSLEEQSKSMSTEHLEQNIAQAQKTKLYPIDLWGAEWWYWLKTTQHDPSKWNTVKELFTVE